MVRPEDVLAHGAPTKSFLCPLSANSDFGIEFLSFVIQDYTTKKTIFEVSRDRPLPIDVSRHDASDPDSLRKINYELSEDFLRLPVVSTTLVFSVGAKPLSDFRMIERHYFRDTLIKSFDFSFGFCIPGSTNTWEACYDLPPMDGRLVDRMIEHPYETASDSFYFVGNELIMHNKAYYKYVREDADAQCKSYEAKYAPSPSLKGGERKAAGRGASTGQGAAAKAQAKSSSSHGAAAAKGAPSAEAKSSSNGDAKLVGGSAKADAKAAAAAHDHVWSKESDYL